MSAYIVSVTVVSAAQPSSYLGSKLCVRPTRKGGKPRDIKWQMSADEIEKRPGDFGYVDPSKPVPASVAPVVAKTDPFRTTISTDRLESALASADIDYLSVSKSALGKKTYSLIDEKKQKAFKAELASAAEAKALAKTKVVQNDFFLSAAPGEFGYADVEEEEGSQSEESSTAKVVEVVSEAIKRTPVSASGDMDFLAAAKSLNLRRY
mmetsp:Transcript_35846/g.57967  ORF Transcript_35846/g.57967 Transcript_35846/m.57967 type:complete len:208 (-) Transcript_35846:169-792(-)|eukprot:CAMPEP_0184675468 /NCGR_PEP_ID=MMETSP0308-20130426/87793_1 /TAXON_ID=38269 /ORGANISM="Gloeochaete witrockiana, Strain SAG 46.84" /LENGTH=207 /DNA_ID=CAMNT_0027123171 /DNA_START=98 /DNA_END=724 /DNA_ORIENTATION=-